MMRFDERAPLAMSIDDFLNDRPGDLMTRRGDPRDVESSISEMQRNWIFPKQVNSVRGEGERRIEFFHRRECCRHVHHHFFQDWTRVVQDYTSRGMTRQSDKLVAIRGIADIFAAFESVEYTAGIWNGSEDSFVQGLLWSSYGPEKRRLDVAPSWSWASVQCEVHWPGLLYVNFQRNAEIVDVKSSGTIAQTAGEIILRTNVRLGVVGTDGNVQIAKWPEVTVNEDFTADGKTSLSIGLTPHWEQAIVTMDEMAQVDTVVYFVELATGQIPAKKDKWSVHALVLTKYGPKKGRFRRVGLSTWNQDFWREPRVPAHNPNAPDAASTAHNRVTEGEDDHTGLELREMEITIV